MEPFARTIDAAKKYVVSSTLKSVDWNAEILHGDLATAVKELKSQPGKGLLTGGVTLPFALAELGLIDEFLKRPHDAVRTLTARVADEKITVADLTHLPVKSRLQAPSA